MTNAHTAGTEGPESFQLPGPLFAQSVAPWPAQRNGEQVVSACILKRHGEKKVAAELRRTK